MGLDLEDDSFDLLTFLSMCVTATARNMDAACDRRVKADIGVLNEIQLPLPPTPPHPSHWKLFQVALINSSGDREVYMTRNTLGEEWEEREGEGQ